MPAPLKLVAVEWIDSKGTTDRWEFRDDLEPLAAARCTTVGFVLERTAEYLTLASTVSPEQVLGRMTIPTRCILKQRTLRNAPRVA